LGALSSGLGTDRAAVRDDAEAGDRKAQNIALGKGYAEFDLGFYFLVLADSKTPLPQGAIIVRS
jgi:hypothetical protein